PGYYVRGLGLLQPLPMALGAIAAALAAVRVPFLRAGVDRDVAPTTLAWLTIAFVAAALTYPQKNLRFLSPIYAPIDLLAAWLVTRLVERLGTRLPAAAFRFAVGAIAAMLIAAAAADHHRFVELFVRRGIPDLATPWFTR